MLKIWGVARCGERGKAGVLVRRAANRELGIKVCVWWWWGGTAQFLGTLQTRRKERELKPLALVFN